MSLRVASPTTEASLGDEPLGFRGSLHRSAAAMAHSRMSGRQGATPRAGVEQVRRKLGEGELATRYDCASTARNQARSSSFITVCAKLHHPLCTDAALIFGDERRLRSGIDHTASALGIVGRDKLLHLLTNPRAFGQATWRHAVFGAVLGRLA